MWTNEKTKRKFPKILRAKGEDLCVNKLKGM